MRTIRVQLNKPIFGGGRPAIGIAEYKLSSADIVEVEIMYRRKKDGQKSWPYIYRMLVSKLRGYPTQVVSGGVKLFVAPLGDWDIV